MEIQIILGIILFLGNLEMFNVFICWPSLQVQTPRNRLLNAKEKHTQHLLNVTVFIITDTCLKFFIFWEENGKMKQMRSLA